MRDDASTIIWLRQGLKLAASLAKESELFDDLDVMRYPICNSDLVGIRSAVREFKNWSISDEIIRDYYSGPPGSYTGD